METHYYWFIAAIVLVVIEIFTIGFAVLCFAIGALFGGLTSLLGFDINVQLSVSIISTILSFCFIRPFTLRYLNRKENVINTNVNALIGRQAIVSETIDNRQCKGRIAIDGDSWRAVSEDGSIIAEGTPITIVKQESLLLTVKQ